MGYSCNACGIQPKLSLVVPGVLLALKSSCFVCCVSPTKAENCRGCYIGCYILLNSKSNNFKFLYDSFSLHLLTSEILHLLTGSLANSQPISANIVYALLLIILIRAIYSLQRLREIISASR